MVALWIGGGLFVAFVVFVIVTGGFNEPYVR